MMMMRRRRSRSRSRSRMIQSPSMLPAKEDDDDDDDNDDVAHAFGAVALWTDKCVHGPFGPNQSRWSCLPSGWAPR